MLWHHCKNFIKMQSHSPKNNKNNIFIEAAVYCKYDLWRSPLLGYEQSSYSGSQYEACFNKTI